MKEIKFSPTPINQFQIVCYLFVSGKRADIITSKLHWEQIFITTYCYLYLLA